MRKAIFPGTFDPFTLGHHSIVKRTLAFMDEVIIGIGYNDQKHCLLPIEKLGPNPEITRFKGLGEISPDEFKNFIGEDMRLEKVRLRKDDLVKDLLEFYMGKNTMERQSFIIENLVVEEDITKEES